MADPSMGVAVAGAVAAEPKQKPAPGHELDDWRAVRAYWAALPPSEVVGFAQEGRSCPLATYLRQQLGAPNPWVDIEGYTLCQPLYAGTLESVLSAALEPVDHPLPNWATMFISCIDMLGGCAGELHPSSKAPKPVEAAVAVQVLDTLLDGLAATHTPA